LALSAMCSACRCIPSPNDIVELKYEWPATVIVQPNHRATPRSTLRKLVEFGGAWVPVRGSMLHRFLGVLGVDAMLRASSVIFLPVYLWLMSQEAYASFNYVMALVGVLSLVCNFGLYVAQSKLWHEFSGRQRADAISTINALLAVMLCGCLLPIYAFGWDRFILRIAFSGTVDYEKYRYLIPLGVVLTVYSQMLLNFFLTGEQITRVQRYNISRLLLGLLLTIGALYTVAGDGAAIRMLAYSAAELLALCVFFPSYALAMRGRFRADIGRRSLSLGLPIMGSGVLGLVINFGDKFFVERYCTLPDMAVYFFGLALSSAITLVAMAFQNVWLPLLLKEPDLAINIGRTRRAACYLLLALTLLSAVIWIAVAVCLYFGIFKPAYAPVLKILPILLASSIATAATGLLSSYTIYWNMTYVTIVTGGIVASVSMPLNFFAVSRFGIYGAAASSVVMNALFALIYLWFVRHQARVRRTASN
jgi:O-antigen/teichoic acid export membrane protein